MSFTEVRTDPLTGDAQPVALDESLSNHISLLSRHNTSFSLAIVDIDHFKRLNDEQGHPYGGEVLTNVAQSMDSSIRETDQVARYGGEEFVVIMPCTLLEGAAIFTDRLRERVGKSMPVTISCGVAEAQLGDTPQSLVARADEALYAAKKGGRNQVCLNNGSTIARYCPEEHDTVTPKLNGFLQGLLERSITKPKQLKPNERNRRRIEHRSFDDR